MPKETLGSMGMGEPRESVADTMRAAFEDDEAGGSASGGDTDSSGDASGDESASTPGERARGADGKFAKTGEKAHAKVAKSSTAPDKSGSGPAKANGKAAAEPDPGTGDDAGPADEPGDSEEAYEPASFWSAAEQDSFRAFPKEAQKFILSQVQNIGSRLVQADEIAQHYQAIEQIIGPRREAWARDGLQPENVIRQVFATVDYARTKPEEFVSWFIANRPNFDVSKLNIRLPNAAPAAQQPGGQNQDIYADDPVVKLVNGRLSPLETQIAKVAKALSDQQAALQQRQQQESATQQQRNLADIDAFRLDRDEKGALKHPYFAEVSRHMGTLLTNHLATNLEQAYEIACRAHPEVHAKIESARKAREAQELAAKARAKAAAAKKTGSSISGQPGSDSESAFTGDVREDLRAGFAEAGWL